MSNNLPQNQDDEIFSLVLSERQSSIIKQYFGIGIDKPRSIDEIGSELGLTPERINHILGRSIVKMRVAGYNNILRDYISLREKKIGNVEKKMKINMEEYNSGVNHPFLYHVSKFSKKIVLFMLLFTILIHYIYLSSKSYSSEIRGIDFTYRYEFNISLSKVSKEMYMNYLNSIDPSISNSNGPIVIQFLKNTKTSYIFGLGEDFIYVIYAAYLLLIATFIFFGNINYLNSNGLERD